MENIMQTPTILRKILDDMEDSQAIEFLIERLKSAKTNDEFLGHEFPARGYSRGPESIYLYS